MRIIPRRRGAANRGCVAWTVALSGPEIPGLVVRTSKKALRPACKGAKRPKPDNSHARLTKKITCDPQPQRTPGIAWEENPRDLESASRSVRISARFQSAPVLATPIAPSQRWLACARSFDGDADSLCSVSLIHSGDAQHRQRRQCFGDKHCGGVTPGVPPHRASRRRRRLTGGRGAFLFINLEQPWTRCPCGGTPSCFRKPAKLGPGESAHATGKPLRPVRWLRRSSPPGAGPRAQTQIPAAAGFDVCSRPIQFSQRKLELGSGAEPREYNPGASIFTRKIYTQKQPSGGWAAGPDPSSCFRRF